MLEFFDFLKTTLMQTVMYPKTATLEFLAGNILKSKNYNKNALSYI